MAKHYAKARSEVAESAKSETTVHFEGYQRGGPMSVKRGSKTGLITDSQESSTTPQHRANPDENHGVRVLLMMLVVTLMDVPMGEEGLEPPTSTL